MGMKLENWEKAKAFHGHECPGLAIGVRASEAAREVMGLVPSADEEIVCITENDACGVDAIQALLGCTIGKGNLVLKPTGKHAYTFVSRKTGRAVRFYLRDDLPAGRQAKLEYLMEAPAEALFSWKELEMPPPAPARIFTSLMCESCGESAPEHKMRLQSGKKVCMDCFEEYSRGW